MRRYAALLRGVSPTNATSADLRRAFEAAGFEDVRTVLSSGNVVFGARAAPATTLERKVEAALTTQLGRTFPAIVRPVDALRELLASGPYRGFRLDPEAKRVVTFLKKAPASSVALPVERDGARILAIDGLHAFTAYVRTPKGPVFMKLIEETFGRAQTTRTWDTVAKVAR